MDEHQLARLASQLSHDELQHGSASPPNSSGSKRAADGLLQPQQRAKRNRYISLACNECKRRKIKCNGQIPCQRCGNLNLDCVYAPNCCNGFKDSQEYKDMVAQISTLRDQVNGLSHHMNAVNAQLSRSMNNHGHRSPVQHPAPPLTITDDSQSQHESHIDPLLQPGGYQGQSQSQTGSFASPANSLRAFSPVSSRRRRQSHVQHATFRGPTSDAFNLDVAKSSLQIMGMTATNGREQDGAATSPAGTREASPVGSLEDQDAMQFIPTLHTDKDPIWSVSQQEAERLCRVYEEEMGILYPLLDIEKLLDYTRKLYRFMTAARKSGLMQRGLPGADAIEDEDTNILKMVLATAMTVEGSGRSELGQRLFEYVQPAIDTILRATACVKGIRLLTMAAIYEFQRDNESTSWRLIGLTTRLCIELGLHRRETYELIQDETEKSETILTFWSIFVLDRRWSFGTGMPFALQDTDIDPQLPQPDDRSPYLSAMIQHARIGSEVWRTVNVSTSSSASSMAPIDTEHMHSLDLKISHWLKNVAEPLRWDPQKDYTKVSAMAQGAPTRGLLRLRILLYLRANHMRIQVYRPILHTVTSIMEHPEQAQKVVAVAKDTIQVLTHVNRTSDIYVRQQVLFNAFLSSALAVLFLSVSHAPYQFAKSVREEFHLALELVRGFSKESFVSKRLWKTIRLLKEVAPKLGLSAEDSAPSAGRQQHIDPSHVDPRSSAAVTMAGMAGHNVDQAALYSSGLQSWPNVPPPITSPDGMANDLTSLFEAAGRHDHVSHSSMQNSVGYGARGARSNNGSSVGSRTGGDETLGNIFKDLF